MELETFKNKIDEAYLEQRPAKRGAAVAAAKKAYKAYLRVEILLRFETIDWTPTLALRVIQGCNKKPTDKPGAKKKAVSRELLARIFTEKGRTAAHKSADFENLDEIVEKIKPTMKKEISEAEVKMAEIVARKKLSLM